MKLKLKLSGGFSAAARAARPAPDEGTTGEGRALVLLVDDEKEILDSLADQLGRTYQVLASASPREALEILASREVAVVISDQRMPELTGTELLAEAARSRPAASRILLTGYADIESVVEAVNRGQIYFYLAKPWRSAELEAVVSRGVERWKLIRDKERLVEALRAANAELEARVLVRTGELEAARAAIERLSRVDPLTGLANRRVLDEELCREGERSRRGGGPLACLAVDLDHFKRVNDTWGHSTGDRLLAAVGAVLHKGVRGIDLAVRTGGEEFLLLLPGTDLEEAAAVAERIRERIGALSVEGLPERVTASVGVAVLAAGESEGEFVARADRALYDAKGSGRNRVALSVPPPLPHVPAEAGEVNGDADPAVALSAGARSGA